MCYEISDYEAERLAKWRRDRRRDRVSGVIIAVVVAATFALVQIAEGVW